MSQCEKVLNALKSGPITSLDAFNELKILRLAARVNDLRNRGVTIVTVLKTTQNANGRKHHYAEYHLHMKTIP
ncbi:MAG: hypothetical protein A3F10_07010 [Coxiella sp. RIFCSPHIGHO2_12_FULL_42_15]|nr:MAG: hypothetical protein A3F10_07010 [Coxiella sp. RIFCSPHIGHO2_12_FULL_42_15]